MVTISDMKEANKKSGHFFFDRGNGKVLPTIYRDKYVIAMNNDRDGYLVWQFDAKSGRMLFVENPSLEYAWKPMTLVEAKAFVKTLK